MTYADADIYDPIHEFVSFSDKVVKLSARFLPQKSTNFVIIVFIREKMETITLTTKPMV